MLVLGAQSPDLASGEPSPTSPTNFRHLDDAFLERQTRMWIGEVLRVRLNEERSIADLLADGELLFEVSKVMLSKYPEPKPCEDEPFSSRSIGRYMPYSYVDSFLTMCKTFGLDGIDLFCPSDVVEKGDTRKVCVCIRSLAKKARSLDLDVPDFDEVTNTITMSTDVSNSSSLAQYRNYGFHSCSEAQEEDESYQCQQVEVGSNLQNDNKEENKVPSSAVDSNAQPGVSLLNFGSGTGNSYISTLVDQIYRKLSPIDKISDVEGSLQCTSPKSNVTDDNQAVSTITVGTYAGGSGSCFPEKTSDKNEYIGQVLDGNDVDVSSAGSVNSMSIHEQNIEFDDLSEMEHCFPNTTDGKFNGMSAEMKGGPKTKDIFGHGTLKHILSTNKKEKFLKVEIAERGLPMGTYGPDAQKQIRNECLQSPIDGSDEDLKVSVKNENMNKKSPIKQTDDQSTGIGKSKSKKRPILKAFVSATALAGAAFLLIHFRKNGREKSGELDKKSNGVRSTNGLNLSIGKGLKVRKAEGVYPSEKLIFGIDLW